MITFIFWVISLFEILLPKVESSTNKIVFVNKYSTQVQILVLLYYTSACTGRGITNHPMVHVHFQVDEVDVHVQVVVLLSIKVGEVQVAMLLSKFKRYLSIYRSGCYLVQNEYIHVQCAGHCVSCYPSKLKTFTYM